MKRVFNPLSAILAVLLFLAPPLAAHSKPVIRISDPSLCIDGMETDPDSDDGDLILAAADGGCMVQPEGVISI